MQSRVTLLQNVKSVISIMTVSEWKKTLKRRFIGHAEPPITATAMGNTTLLVFLKSNFCRCGHAIGVEQDLEQAAFWYKKAALQNHDLAIEKCRELGVDLNAPKLGREEIRKELKCRIYPLGYLERYKFTVICANYRGKWILSKHKKRNTWETQGGHIEAGEDPIECARRELFEESGIKDADIYPVCDYWGFDPQSCSNGMVFLAVVHSLGELPESEMNEIGIFDTLPAELTYPQVSPRLYEEAEKLLSTL